MTPDAVVLVPGILGTELTDRDGRLIWGLEPSLLFRHRRLRRIIEQIALVEGGDDGIQPGRPVRFPAWLPILDGLEPYQSLTKALRGAALRESAVLEFGYDWRRSVETAAQRLSAAVTGHMAAWRDQFSRIDVAERGKQDPRVTFVCHSMGGLVASWFARFLDPHHLTRRIITLGTPFLGSVKAARLIADGDIAPFGLLAEPLRSTARTLPGVHDLLPSYACVGPGQCAKPTIEDFVALGADRSHSEAAAHRAGLLASGLRSDVEVRSMAGVNQQTLSSWDTSARGTTFHHTIGGIEPKGDGTVFVGASFRGGQIPGGYLPQRHGSLARTDEAIAFVRAVLAEDELRQFQATDGPGLLVPHIASPGEELELEVTTWDGASTIEIDDAATGRTVDRLTPLRRDGRRVATIVISQPGLYRARLTAGSHSDITELLAVLDPDDT